MPHAQLPKSPPEQPAGVLPARLATSLMKLARLDRQIGDMIGQYDHVTHLPNRLRFLADYAQLCGDGSVPRILVLVTLADARHYNEILRALGHAFSEDLVRTGVGQLQGLLPADLHVYHVSVLSFAFVIGRVGDVPPLATTIASAFSGDIRVNDIPIKTRVGVGLMPLTPDLDPSEALRAALAAAQDSRSTEAGVAFYNHKTDAAHIRAFRILSDLPAALAARDQLHLAFQPRTSMLTGKTQGAEALLRWTHPELGPISPGEFIPLTEQTSLIGPLTDWVLDAATTQIRTFLDHGHDLRVSVNASPANLSEPGFAERILKLCDSRGITPKHIELEFTEGMLAGNSDRAARQLEHLRRSGVDVAIDDFGTGFANLSYLAGIPADVLKIDRSFVTPLTADDDFLVRHIIELAHGLNFRVCAEGIETATAYTHLRDLGCDEGQGYYIARPLPAADFYSWLAAEEPLPR